MKTDAIIMRSLNLIVLGIVALVLMTMCLGVAAKFGGRQNAITHLLHAYKVYVYNTKDPIGWEKFVRARCANVRNFCVIRSTCTLWKKLCESAKEMLPSQ
ncbi:hypothetical protein ENBRE01_2939 [Enteropsectra breve]|nr:hypothetical protein ENBRE01_2939 [Enteropsectra breve]